MHDPEDRKELGLAWATRDHLLTWSLQARGETGLNRWFPNAHLILSCEGPRRGESWGIDLAWPSEVKASIRRDGIGASKWRGG